MELEVLGWSPGLVNEDLDWLLRDTPLRAADNERRLGINALMDIWNKAGRLEPTLQQIRAIAAGDPAMHAALDLWINPPPPDPALTASEAELRRVVRRNKAKRRRIDQSWLNLIQQLRRDPEQLRHLPPATAQGVDPRLYHLWQLLSNAVVSNARYAVGTVRSIEPALGPELAAAFRDGLIRHWRTWQPVAKSTRPADSRNTINSLDAMGIAGVSMEADSGPGWVENLDSNLARRAALYATMEINGLPAWLADLSDHWPAEVSSVLLTEVKAELDTNERYGLLYAISRTDARTVSIMTAPLLQEFETRSDLSAAVLEPIFDVLKQTADDQARACLLNLCTDRFSVAANTSVASLYIGTAFGIDSIVATEALLKRIDGLDARDQTALVQGVLPAVFGTRFSHERKRPNIDLRSLERLVRVAYRTIRIEDDRNRPSGVVYSPDSRDHAEDARGAAFNQLTEIPGLATLNALMALTDVGDFPIAPAHLRALARERAAKDSEAAPWPPGEASAYEEKCESLPRTSVDLQRLLLSRLEDLQQDLNHGDFGQGAVLRSLPRERDVQNFLAHRLRSVQGRSYGIEREPHVADEKEPDIRARSATDASVPIEIKVAESWTLEQLHDALRVQLCARYLRARDAKHGILLLAHQNARPRGWSDPRTS